MRALVGLVVLSVGCGHAQPSQKTSREIVGADRAAASEWLSALPRCLAPEWEGAQSVEALLAGKPETGADVRLKGVVRPTLVYSTLLQCIRLEQKSYSAADVLEYVAPACCNHSASELWFTDPGKPRPALVLALGTADRFTRDCSQDRVQRDFARVPVLVWGKVAGFYEHDGRWFIAPDRMCRGDPVGAPEPPEPAPDPREQRVDLMTGLVRLAEQHAGDELGEQAFGAALNVAAQHQNRPEDDAVVVRLLAKFPGSKARGPALHGLFDRALQSFRFADASTYAGLAAGDGPFDDQVRYSGARVRLALGDRAGALALLAGKSSADRALARAQLQLELGLLAEARASADQVVAKRRDEAAAIIAEVAARGGPAAPTNLAASLSPRGGDAAKARWYLAEPRYQQVLLGRGDLEALRREYAAVLEMQSPEWGVAALWREALALRRAGKNPAAAFAACVALAEKEHVFTAAALGCRRQAEAVELPLPAVPAALPVDVEALRLRAVGSGVDEDFEEVALRVLAAHRVKEARLMLQVAADHGHGGASAYSALGFTALLEGEPMQAWPNYARACGFGSDHYGRACANLAALHCRFGDVEGARRYLAMLRPDDKLTGPDVDPDWQRCR